MREPSLPLLNQVVVGERSCSIPRPHAWARWPMCSPGGEAVLDGEDGGTRPGAPAGLVIDAREVVLDGPRRDDELLGDLRVRQAAGAEAQDVDLAVGEVVRPGGARAREP